MRLPSPEYREAERVRRAALRALRSGMRSRLTPAALQSIAGCEPLVARNALETLAAGKQLSKRTGKTRAGDEYALTEQGRAGDAL